MGHYRKFVKDVGVLGFVLALSRVKGIILLMILTKSLGAESYGIWTQILVTLSFVTPIAVLGLPNALVRFLPGAQTKKDVHEHVWSTVLLVAGGAAAIALPLLVFPQVIANFLQTPSSLMILLAFLIVLESLNALFVDIFRTFGEIGVYSLMSLSLAGGEVAFTAISIAMGYGLFGAVAALVLIRCAVFLLSLGMLAKRIGFGIPTFSHAKEYITFGLPTVLSNTSHWAVQVSDRYVIAGFLGVLFVGYYAPAYTIALIINLFILPVMLILQPLLAKLFAERNLEKIRIYLSYSLKYILFVTIPAASGLVILSKQILMIFSTYDIAIHASPIVPFVAISIVLYGIHGVFAQILLLFKKTNADGTIWTIAAVVSIALNLVLIPPLGILGAAIATLIAYAIALSLTVIYALRHLSFFIDWKFVGKSVAASFLMSVIILLLSVQGFWGTVIAVIAGVMLYGTLMFLMGSFNQREKEFFVAFLRAQ